MATAQGKTTVDFGAFPGDTNVELAITGQGSILDTMLVDAWIVPEATADHSVDEHVVDAPVVSAGNIVDGVGFTIYAKAKNGTTHGLWTVGWVWNG